jgi:hypothetical protein
VAKQGTSSFLNIEPVEEWADLKSVTEPQTLSLSAQSSTDFSSRTLMSLDLDESEVGRLAATKNPRRSPSTKLGAVYGGCSGTMELELSLKL